MLIIPTTPLLLLAVLLHPLPMPLLVIIIIVLIDFLITLVEAAVLVVVPAEAVIFAVFLFLCGKLAWWNHS
jgi:hypothetical protein